MSLYRLEVIVYVEADHLFPAIMRAEDALKPVASGKVFVDYDRNDPQNASDVAGAAALLAPAGADFDEWVGEREIRGES